MVSDELGVLPWHFEGPGGQAENVRRAEERILPVQVSNTNTIPFLMLLCDIRGWAVGSEKCFSPSNRRLIKSTFFLVALFGLHCILFVFLPVEVNSSVFKIWTFAELALSSTQVQKKGQTVYEVLGQTGLQRWEVTKHKAWVFLFSWQLFTNYICTSVNICFYLLHWKNTLVTFLFTSA